MVFEVSGPGGSMAFGLYVIALGAALAVGGAVSVARGWRSTTWPSTVGQVSRTSIEADSDGVRNVRIVVDYEVDGRRFERREVAPIGGFPTEARAHAAAGRLPTGTPLVVRFDPRRPHVARLRPGVRVASVVTTVGGAVLVVVGLWILIAA
jgi:hypothetical protein